MNLDKILLDPNPTKEKLLEILNQPKIWREKDRNSQLKLQEELSYKARISTTFAGWEATVILLQNDDDEPYGFSLKVLVLFSRLVEIPF